jgi:putative Mn2+ efflux pump MntP
VTECDLDHAADAMAYAISSGLFKRKKTRLLDRMVHPVLFSILLLAIVLASMSFYVILNEWISLLPTIIGAF